MEQKELDEILEQHKLWCDTEREQGKRADFRGANLSWANLENADLRWAKVCKP